MGRLAHETVAIATKVGALPQFTLVLLKPLLISVPSLRNGRLRGFKPVFFTHGTSRCGAAFAHRESACLRVTWAPGGYLFIRSRKMLLV